MIKAIAASLVLVFLCACSTLEEKRVLYEEYSCSQLAEERGKWKQVQSGAESDELDSDLTALFAGDDEEEFESEIDSLIAGSTAIDAGEHLQEINRISAAKGCS